MNKKSDLSGLVATKGQATPLSAEASMQSDRKEAEPPIEAQANNEPLNFRVSAEFRRRFRMFAAAHDLKLNELLKLAFDDYEAKHGPR
jgi:hypothetical protein